MKWLALTLLVAVVASVSITNARGGGRLSPAQIRFWDRVAACEEGGRWWQGGDTYVGGLGIWYGNWWKWARHLGIRTEASATGRLDQMRVAQWGYEQDRAWWGCFEITGLPIV